MLVGIEAEEFFIVGNINRITMLILDSLIAGVQTLIEHIRHRGERDGAFVFNVQGVASRTSATAAAANQRNLQGIVLGRVHVGQRNSGRGRSRREVSGALQKLSS